MSESETEPIPSELEALFAAERRRPDLPAALQLEILRGVRATLTTGGGGSAPPAPSTPSRAPANPIAGWKGVVAGAAMGVIVGAGGHALLRPAPPPRVVVVTRERVVEV